MAKRFSLLTMIISSLVFLAIGTFVGIVIEYSVNRISQANNSSNSSSTSQSNSSSSSVTSDETSSNNSSVVSDQNSPPTNSNIYSYFQYKAVYMGEGSIIASQYKDYLLFETCSNYPIRPQLCNGTLYFLPKTMVQKGSILSFPALGTNYYLQGKIQQNGGAQGAVFDFFTSFDKAYVVGAYQGSIPLAGGSYLEFKSCPVDTTQPGCQVFLLYAAYQANYRVLTNVKVGDQFKISGNVENNGGGTAGTTYLYLTSYADFLSLNPTSGGPYVKPQAGNNSSSGATNTAPSSIY